MSVDGMHLIFKLATSPSLMSLLYPGNYKYSEQLRTLLMDLDRIDGHLQLQNFLEEMFVDYVQQRIYSF